MSTSETLVVPEADAGGPIGVRTAFCQSSRDENPARLSQCEQKVVVLAVISRAFSGVVASMK